MEIVRKNIALVAHDARKSELIDWVDWNKAFLTNHKLYGTGTTAKLISEKTGLEIEGLMSGPLGGDAEIGAMIAKGEIDCLIFFCDNLSTQGHQNDIFGLVRLASLYNIPFATNRTTADYIITSPCFTDKEYVINLPRAIENYKTRFVC